MVARVQNNGLANITAAWVAYASLAKYLQWGTGSGAAASANVVTTTSTTEARTTGTASQVTTTQTNDTYQVVGTITAAGTRAITEVGVFDAAGAGSPNSSYVPRTKQPNPGRPSLFDFSQTGKLWFLLRRR